MSTPIIPDGIGGLSTGSGMFSSSTLQNDLSDAFVGLPGSGSTSASGSTAGSSIWDILGDQSSLGTGTGNPSTAASAIGTTTGTSNSNTTANPGGTNPGGSGSGILATIEKYKYNIFAVILGVIFVIIGAVQMAKASGMPAMPVA